MRVTAQGRSAADIAAIPVKRVDERTVLVRDVAQVVDSVEEARSLAFVNDRPAIALDVQKQAGANTVGVADGVLAAVAALAPELPPGVSLQVVRDDSTFIRESIEDVQVTLVLGGLLTVFIVFLFLNSWRSTVITGLTLPISVVAAFIAMRFFGFTLNVLTLMGLSLAIGMLIDDAIVVRENIVRHMQRGKDHLDGGARRHGRDRPRRHGDDVHDRRGVHSRRVHVGHGRPVLLRIRHHRHRRRARVAVRQLHARPDAVVPLVRSGRRGASPPRIDRPRAAALQQGVRQSARQRTSAASTGRCGTAGSWWPSRSSRSSAPSRFSRSSAATSCRTSTAASIRCRSSPRPARRCAKPATARWRWSAGFAPLPDVEYTYTTIGEAGSSFRPVTEGSTFVKLKESRGQTFSEVLREGRRAVEVVPGLTFGFTEAGAFGQKPIQISVRGPEVEVLDRVSKEFVAEVRRVPGVADIESSLEKSKPELRIEIDRQRASDLGIPAATIATTLQAGVVGQVATTIEDAAGDNHNVRVRLRPDQRRFSEDLMLLSVPTDKDDDLGDKILKPLREVADVLPGSGPSSIRRRDLVREVRVSANTDGRPLQEVSNEIMAAAAAIDAAAGLRHRRRRRHRRARQHVHQHVRGADPRGDLHLPDSGVAVRIVHASSRDHAVAAAVARRRRDHAVSDGRHAQHHEHDRPDHADGAGHEERHPARGLHQPGTGRRAVAASGAAAGRARPGCVRS